MSTPSFRSSGDLAADRRYLWAEGAARDADFLAAADLYEQALDLAPRWASCWFALGQMRERLDDKPRAITAYQQCLLLEPDDLLGAGLRLSLLENKAGTAAMSGHYVRALFDAYADRFDDHLVGTLAYRGPALLYAALHRLTGQLQIPFRFRHMLDLGCGTGLMGVALKAQCERIEGVDLAPRMIEKARETGVYAALETGDAISFLRHRRLSDTARGHGDPMGADLVIAADVLVYIGALDALFDATTQALMKQGLFAFTVQEGTGPDYHLGEDMRFAHELRYIRDLAKTFGFSCALMERVTTRKDRGADVPGLLFILRKD